MDVIDAIRRDLGRIESGFPGMNQTNFFGMLVKGHRGGAGRLPELPKLVIAEIGYGVMVEIEHGSANRARKPTERYAYYRRCQEFRRNGEQCKAPAEKGEQICHAHAGQRAMAERRERERRVVLAAAAAKMRCSMTDLFMSFNGIQVTIAATAQTLIAGRIDCKTAVRLLWDLQRMAKLLRVAENILPQISADERRSKRVEATKEMVLTANERESTRIIKPALVVFPGNQWSNGPPRWAKAA